MEPSVHRLAFDADAHAVLSNVEAELSRQGEPPVTMRRVLVFESDTGDFMLRARVADALMNVAWPRRLAAHVQATRLGCPVVSGLHLLPPGSESAQAQGCLCDSQEPHTVDGPNGEPLPAWTYEPTCPVHGLAVMHGLFHEGRD